jgi:hypothetical protein
MHRWLYSERVEASVLDDACCVYVAVSWGMQEDASLHACERRDFGQSFMLPLSSLLLP